MWYKVVSLCEAGTFARMCKALGKKLFPGVPRAPAHYRDTT
jgi:hypothetical protein